jgi:hypothetical protein
VAGLLQRGDEAMLRDDWDSAENCYLAAYYCNGGRGTIIKEKIDLVKQIIAIASSAASAETRLATARYTPAALTVLRQELESNRKSVSSCLQILPDSEQLQHVSAQLDRILRQTRRYLS